MGAVYLSSLVKVKSSSTFEALFFPDVYLMHTVGKSDFGVFLKYKNKKEDH